MARKNLSQKHPRLDTVSVIEDRVIEAGEATLGRFQQVYQRAVDNVREQKIKAGSRVRRGNSSTVMQVIAVEIERPLRLLRERPGLVSSPAAIVQIRQPNGRTTNWVSGIGLTHAPDSA